MICSQCQTDNPPDASFCDQCGVRLDMLCPNCGETNRRTARFCRSCGSAINQAPAAPPAAVAASPAPITYVPKHLSEKIFASRQALEGERKHVTVLFADIRGSTAMIEGRDPEEAQKIIDPVLHLMMKSVHRYEGTVNQVLGDGIMALFGAPLAHEDHALRACYAALAIQEELHRHRKSLGQSEEAGVQIGIGMNTGEVVVRSIDNDLNLEYSALGHTTHLAARMQELAGGGTSLMTSSTLREVEGFVQVRALGPVQIKGVSHLFDRFELVGATTARTRVQAAGVRGLTPLVGRDTEIAIFKKLVQQAAAGHGQILAMLGEAGMGKSRLVHEFTRHQLPPGWLVVEAASVSYGKATPYFPLIEMLRRYFQIADEQTADGIRELVTLHILELDNTLKDVIAPVLSLLGALPDEKRLAQEDRQSWLAQHPEIAAIIQRFNALDPQQRRRHTLDAIKRLLVRESHRQPILVVLEDLHWIDNETQAFLDSMIESLPLVQILLLVNYRPGYEHVWGSRSYYTQLRVEPLPQTGAEELLRHLLGHNRDLAPLREMLLTRTEGNPFFAEESVRSLVETGFLLGEKGAYRPGQQVESIQIPGTVQSLLADRIDRLPADEKHLLQTAAVIGVIVPFGLLRDVVELPDDRLYQQLSTLQAGEFLYERVLFPEPEFRFKHALTNEVAYGELLHERRRALHARIFFALEKRVGESILDHVETLAHHAYAGELWDQAVHYLAQSGAKALACSASKEAAASLDRALSVVEQLPESRQKQERRVDLRLQLRNALFLLGASEPLFRALREAEGHAKSLGDSLRLARVYNFLCSYFGIAGDPDGAVEYGLRALDLIAERDEPDLVATAHYYLGAAYNKNGEYRKAIDVLARGLRGLSDERERKTFGTALVVAVSCRSHLAQCLAATGSFDEAETRGQQGVEIAAATGHQASTVYAKTSLGVVWLLRGEAVKAVQALQEGFKICKTAELRVYEPFVKSRLGAALTLHGDVDQGLQYLEQGVNEAFAVGRVGFLSLSMVWLSMGYLSIGRLDDAVEYARRALELSRTHKERGHEAWALKALADSAIKASSANIEAPLESYRRALSLVVELDMHPLEAHCHAALGNLFALHGEAAQARAELNTAVESYNRLGMAHWLPAARVELAKVS